MINIWAVIVCAVLSMVIGMAWYGKMLFGKSWMRVMGVDMSTMTPERQKEMQKKMWPSYLAQFILSIISVVVLSITINKFLVFGAWGGMQVAALMWLGFMMPIAAGGALWSGKSKKNAWDMFLISASYQLVSFVIFGAILAVWF